MGHVRPLDPPEPKILAVAELRHGTWKDGVIELSIEPSDYGNCEDLYRPDVALGATGDIVFSLTEARQWFSQHGWRISNWRNGRDSSRWAYANRP